MSKTEISAGGVVYRRLNGEVKVLVAKHSGYHKWVLPKGLVEEGESLETTAVREVEEEVGVKAKIISKLEPPEQYTYIFNGGKIAKTVHYFLMEYVSGDEQEHDFEMEEVKWVTFREADLLLGFEGAKRILATAKQIVGNPLNYD